MHDASRSVWLLYYFRYLAASALIAAAWIVTAVAAAAAATAATAAAAVAAIVAESKKDNDKDNDPDAPAKENVIIASHEK